MAGHGETVHLGAPEICPDCSVKTHDSVCCSGGGWYIGRYCDCGVYTRESEYYPNQEAAKDALGMGTVRWRTADYTPNRGGGLTVLRRRPRHGRLPHEGAVDVGLWVEGYCWDHHDLVDEGISTQAQLQQRARDARHRAHRVIYRGADNLTDVGRTHQDRPVDQRTPRE